MEKIEGTIVKTIYRNPRDGYSIALFRPYDINGYITIKGYLPPPIRQLIEIEGEKVDNPKYHTWTMQVYGYAVVVPPRDSDIREYLASGAIKGLGSATAKKIVNKFGAQTLDIIENDIDRLAEVKGVGQKVIEIIKKARLEGLIP